MTNLWVVDAFTNRPFHGNPAAVCVLDGPRESDWMQLVAREMNLSETAFLHPMEGGWSLRWFTPKLEVSLCGHATLASAFVLWESGVVARDTNIRFHTLSGWLSCKNDGSWIEMDFPASPLHPCKANELLTKAFSCEFQSIQRSNLDYLIEVADEETLRALRPDFGLLRQIESRGFIVTARGKSVDFVSRFFAPGAGIDEDPVTGSAHCALGPFWQRRLGKSSFIAHQLSERGGEIHLTVVGDRVLLRGQCVSISRVELF